MLKTDALVLNSYFYRENDKIVKIFSKEKGLINLYAPGVNKLISKNRFSLQTFSISEFEIFYSQKSNINKLKRGLIKSSNIFLSSNYELYLFFCYFTDILEKLLIPKKQYHYLYSIIENFLLTNNDNNWFVGITFLFYKLINFSGTLFLVENCYYCKQKSNIKTFSFSKFSFICKNCIKKEPVLDLFFLKLIYNWSLIVDYKEAIEFSKHLSEKHLLLLFVFLVKYYSEEIGIFTNSLYQILNNDFFKKIQNIAERILNE